MAPLPATAAAHHSCISEAVQLAALSADWFFPAQASHLMTPAALRCPLLRGHDALSASLHLVVAGRYGVPMELMLTHFPGSPPSAQAQPNGVPCSCSCHS